MRETNKRRKEEKKKETHLIGHKVEVQNQKHSYSCAYLKNVLLPVIIINKCTSCAIQNIQFTDHNTEYIPLRNPHSHCSFERLIIEREIFYLLALI